jgi:hypothetical protein
LLAVILSRFPGRLQLPVALRVDLLLTPSQQVLRTDASRGAVQTDIVGIVDVGHAPKTEADWVKAGPVVEIAFGKTHN